MYFGQDAGIVAGQSLQVRGAVVLAVFISFFALSSVGLPAAARFPVTAKCEADGAASDSLALPAAVKKGCITGAHPEAMCRSTAASGQFKWPISTAWLQIGQCTVIGVGYLIGKPPPFARTSLHTLIQLSFTPHTKA